MAAGFYWPFLEKGTENLVNFFVGSNKKAAMSTVSAAIAD